MTKLLVAIDGMTPLDTINMTAKLNDYCDGIKLGDIIVEEGVNLIRILKQQHGVFVMSDNKWWDIPKTVYNKVRREAEAGADLITVSLYCDPESLEAARKAAGAAKLIGVTVLTSKQIWLPVTKESSIGFTEKAAYALELGLDGITVPAPYLQFMNDQELWYKGPCGRYYRLCDKLIAITPGVRMPGDDHRDQKMVATVPPINADYAVVGDPIINSEDPRAAAQRYRTWLKGV